MTSDDLKVSTLYCVYSEPPYSLHLLLLPSSFLTFAKLLDTWRFCLLSNCTYSRDGTEWGKHKFLLIKHLFHSRTKSSHINPSIPRQAPMSSSNWWNRWMLGPVLAGYVLQLSYTGPRPCQIVKYCLDLLVPSGQMSTDTTTLTCPRKLKPTVSNFLPENW